MFLLNGVKKIFVGNGKSKHFYMKICHVLWNGGIGGIESIIPTEGIVFVYKGKTMKLTGTFAAINQLMGIIKYGR